MPPGGSFTPGAKIERIAANVIRPDKALNAIGLFMVAESQKAFKAQEFGGRPWRARAVPNVFGVLADFAAGKREPAKRRFDARPALQDTGALARSITHRVVGDVVEVGSALKYASVHNFGGTVESAPITETMQSAMGAWLKRQDLGLRRRLGWLLNRKMVGKRLQQQVPPRPFVGVTQQTRDAVAKALRIYITEATP